MAELHLISTALSAERQLDVVFVLGLGGNWQGTWGIGGEEGDSLPHWLAAEFVLPIGVWSLSYPASSRRLEWLKAAIQATVCGERRDSEAGAAIALLRRAANVLDRLALPGIGQRPVVFITHSLGGLLVKSVLRLAAESPDAPERRRVVERTRGVMFVAMPHQGSSLATLATLATALQFYLPSVSVRDLRANDAHLNALFLWYRSYAPRHNILTRSYVENQATNGVVVVSASSADPGVTRPTARDPVPLDRNHVEICRPHDRGDQ
jgi:hypothetical protein